MAVSKYDKIYAEDLIDLKNRIGVAKENLTSLNTDADESKKKLADIFLRLDCFIQIPNVSSLTIYDYPVNEETFPSADVKDALTQTFLFKRVK